MSQDPSRKFPTYTIDVLDTQQNPYQKDEKPKHSFDGRREPTFSQADEAFKAWLYFG